VEKRPRFRSCQCVDDADGDRIQISATDLELGMYVPVQLRSRKQGDYDTGKELPDIIRSPDDDIKIKSLDNNCQINCASTFKIVGPQRQFPNLPEISKRSSIFLPKFY
jgi:DNA polymerase III sliding clamp (beta) subunit (PCNA family)